MIMSPVWRCIAGAMVIVGLLVTAACAPASAPSPTPPPAKPTNAPAADGKPAAASASTSAPPAAKPAAGADWQAEWAKVLEAAKKEGKVVIAGGPGEMYRTAALAFQKTYPDIQIEFTGITGRDFGPKILAERSGGQYLWDVHMGGSTTPMTTLKPNGVLAPLRPAFIHPAALDDTKWVGGFEESWMDKERKYIFAFE